MKIGRSPGGNNIEIQTRRGVFIIYRIGPSRRWFQRDHKRLCLPGVTKILYLPTPDKTRRGLTRSDAPSRARGAA